MRILIAYDGSQCADAAIDDLLRAGLPLRGFVTDEVAAYIAANGLYRTTNE